MLGRPELVALGAPFGVLVALGLALAHDPAVAVELELDRDRAIEGDEIGLTVRLTGQGLVELALPLPRGVGLVDGSRAIALRLARGRPETLELRVRCSRWGAYVLGDAAVRAHDRFGLYTWEGRRVEHLQLKVFPRPELFRAVLPPLETQATAGNHVARTAGDGIEFADLREFVPGDRVRTINWRASARRGELWVNQMHPERNADVVLFLDTFTEAAHYGAGGTLDYGVRAAAALAAQYLEHRDRVGLVSFGGILNWLVPASGVVQRYRIVDALLDTEIVLNYAWKDVEIIPRGTLPPKALVAGADAPARRARRGHAARPARPRLRPHGDRDLPRPLRRACARPRRRGRAPAVADAARGAAVALPARRRADRGVARRDTGRGRAGGGEGVATRSPVRARIGTGAAALVPGGRAHARVRPAAWATGLADRRSRGSIGRRGRGRRARARAGPVSSARP